MAIRFTHKVLVSGWIMIVGLISLSAPPMGVAASLSMLMVGVLVVPALVLIPRPIGFGLSSLDSSYKRWVAKRRKVCGSASAQRTR